MAQILRTMADKLESADKVSSGTMDANGLTVSIIEATLFRCKATRPTHTSAAIYFVRSLQHENRASIKLHPGAAESNRSLFSGRFRSLRRRGL
jgi:hypothetical protein